MLAAGRALASSKEFLGRVCVRRLGPGWALPELPCQATQMHFCVCINVKLPLHIIVLSDSHCEFDESNPETVGLHVLS